ncbi:NUDIX hydrolase [Streptomyces sp. NPDC020490]|uniref:NUDIX hydrolase n=1 Tax=Streptomyces sp. NPDC020490 TaxID=3365078 RepID=UPI00379F3A6A
MTKPTTVSDQQLAVLAPLATLIETTIRDTPIRMGPGGLDDLTGQLTVKTCVWVGKNVLPRTKSLAAFVADVDAERQRQLAKFGDQHHPDGTGSKSQQDDAERARRWCQDAFGSGYGTWVDILTEEVVEAYAERDRARLRAELVQVAAVCAAWIADLDSRPAARSAAAAVTETPASQ